MSEAGPRELGLGAGGRHVLRLFVSGTTPRSMRAIANLRRVLEREMPGRYELAVIDIYQDPEAARDHQVIAAPTLVKLLPEPVRRIIGDLSDVQRVLTGLGIEALGESGGEQAVG